jgi:hypothetical protein
MPHIIRPGQRWNSVKYKTYYFLSLREERGIFEPITVNELAYWVGLNVRSLQVLVVKWRSPSWRRILRRTLPDGRHGYVLGARGRKWLADAPLFIHEYIRDHWVNEIIEHQQRIAERRRLIEARAEFHRAHGYWPS